jgi:site-specific recombinase XerD
MQAELLDYLRFIRPRIAAGTQRRMQCELQHFLRYLDAQGLALQALSTDHIQAYLGTLDASHDSKWRRLRLLRGFYAFLGEKNPAEGVPMQPRRQRRLFRVPQESQLADALGRLSNPATELQWRNRLMFELLYGSGIRRSELVQLDIEDIDLHDCSAEVLGKGGRRRVVPLTSAAMNVLQEYLRLRRARRGPLLRTYAGRRLSAAAASYVCVSVLGIRPHLLRHACATGMMRNGCDVRHIQELLGHKNLQTTQLYTHITGSELRTAVNRLHPRGTPPRSGTME